MKEALSDLLYVPFAFETGGSSIVLYSPSAYAEESYDRRNYRHLQKDEYEMFRRVATGNGKTVNLPAPERDKV